MPLLGVRVQRQRQGLRQAEVAQKARMATESINRIEAGRPVRVSTARRLAAILKVEVETLRPLPPDWTPDGFKVCRGPCRQTRPLTDFSSAPSGRELDGYWARCFDCVNRKKREYRRQCGRSASH